MAHYYDFLRWQDGSRIQRIRLENSKETFGSPYYTAHRADLHIALLEKAQAAGVTIIGNKRVLSYDFETPSVSMEGGDIINADIVIACDGETLQLNRFSYLHV